MAFYSGVDFALTQIAGELLKRIRACTKGGLKKAAPFASKFMTEHGAKKNENFSRREVVFGGWSRMGRREKHSRTRRRSIFLLCYGSLATHSRTISKEVVC